MLYTEHIQKALDYIEAHLACECTLEGCARAAGYSAYHFSRIFRAMTGLPPIDYVRKRRLTGAAIDLAHSALPVIDVAVKWGFESAETFIRAFEAEHGVTPGRYRGTGMSLHLTEPFTTPTTDFTLAEPTIAELPERLLCGYPFADGPGAKHGAIPRFWNQYHEQRLGYGLPGASPDGWFEDVGCSLFGSNGEHTYVVGTWAKGAGPAGTALITIPAGLYAVFRTPQADAFTFVETIHKTWDAIFTQWLPGSGYVRTHRLQYECYCEISHTFSEQIYIPITKRRE